MTGGRLAALATGVPTPVRRMVYRSRVAHRAARLVASALYPNDEWSWQRIRAGVAAGAWLQAQPRTHKFQLAGTYEPEVQSFLLDHLRPGATLWDVGAHIGFTAVLAARCGARVVALEPLPENAERLRAVVRLNGVGAAIVEAAAGAVRSRARLAEGADSSTGALSDIGLEVDVVALDDLLVVHPAPTIVKIDVEGAEADVLQGAQHILREVKPTFVIELHPRVADPAVTLEQLGDYRVETIDEHHVAATPR